MDNRIDLIFQKEPEQVQQKLMQLLLHYNATLQYNSKQDKFQVDLLLPFQSMQEKSQFLSEFYRSRSSNHYSTNRPEQSDHQQDQGRRHSVTKSENTKNNKIETNQKELILQEFVKRNEVILNKNYSQFNHKQKGQHELEIEFVNKQAQQSKRQGRDKDSATASTKLGQIHVNFETISKVLDENLFKAIYSIKQQRRRQKLYGSQNSNSNSSKQLSQNQNNKSRISNANSKNQFEKQQQISMEQKNQISNPFEKKSNKYEQTIERQNNGLHVPQKQIQRIFQSPIYNLKGFNNEIFIDEDRQQSETELKKQGQQLSEVQSEGKINMIPSSEEHLSYNSPTSKRYYNDREILSHQSQNSSNTRQILIEDESGFSQEYYQNQASLGTTIRSNNQNFSSFVIGKIIQQNMEHQQQSQKSQDFNYGDQIPYDKQIQLFPRTDKNKQLEFSPNSYVEKYKQYKQQHQNFLNDKYKKHLRTANQSSQGKQIKNERPQHTGKGTYKSSKKEDQIIPTVAMKKSYDNFFKNNQKNLQRLYEQIQKDIKKNKGNRYTAHFQSLKSSSYSGRQSQNDSILIQEDDYIDEQEDANSEQAAFKKEIMQQYTDKILVNNQTMSSEDLIRYFRYLLRNARSLYAKHIRTHVSNGKQKPFLKPFK